MTMLVVQTLLLVLAAFFAGAMIACFMRRVFFARDNERPSPSGGGRHDTTAEETVVSEIKTTTQTTTKATSSETARFNRALTGVGTTGSGPTPMSTERKVRIDTDGDNGNFSVEQADAPLATATSATASVVTVKTTQAQNESPANDDQNLQNASGATTDAFVSVSPKEAPTQVSHKSPSSDVATLRSVRSEALVGSGHGESDSNIFELSSANEGDVDDLKRIRGVGVLIEKKLNAMGVRTYTQIANWTAADVARVSETLDFKGRIERESWIEQARILASGGYTDFSRRTKSMV